MRHRCFQLNSTQAVILGIGVGTMTLLGVFAAMGKLDGASMALCLTTLGALPILMDSKSARPGCRRSPQPPSAT